jgi:hypothetical protein
LSAPSLPLALQRRLTSYYGLDDTPEVDAFVRVVVEPWQRERLLVRDGDDGVEVALELPAAALAERAPLTLDDLCQVVEGVSHFVLIAERARCELPTTHLELELQAEIDKFVLLSASDTACLGRSFSNDGGLHAPVLRRRLFGAVRFTDPPGTERGDRYRMVHQLAGGYASRLERDFIRRDRPVELRSELRRFYRAGQAAKIALARAA